MKVARRVNPDVAVVDLGLPDMNGLQLIRDLNNQCRPIEIVVLSTHADQAYVTEAFRAGAKGYVGKDAPSSELIEGIREVGQGNRYLSSTLNQSQHRNCKPGETVRTDKFASLTAREKEVLAQIADGLKSQQIGDRMKVGKRTVDSHRSHIAQKLELSLSTVHESQVELPCARGCCTAPDC